MVTHEGLKNGVGCVGGSLEDRDRGAGGWPLAKDKIFHITKLHNDINQLSFDGRCRNNSISPLFGMRKTKSQNLLKRPLEASDQKSSQNRLHLKKLNFKEGLF